MIRMSWQIAGMIIENRMPDISNIDKDILAI